MKQVYRNIKQSNIKFAGVIVALIMTIMVGMGGMACAESNDESSQLTQKGFEYFKTKEYNKVIETLTKAIESDPNNNQAYLGRGNAYLYKNMNDEAIKDFNKALEIDPASYRNYALRAFAYYNKGLHDKSKEDCNLFFKYAPPSDPMVKSLKSFAINAGYMKKIVTVDITVGNERMNRLLTLGVNNGDIEMVKTAIDNGANVNIYTYGDYDTPLSLAVSKRNIPMIDFLISKGADANVVLNHVANGRYPNLLMKYANCGETITTKLLDAGADINFLDKYNQNIFFYILSSTSNKIDFQYYISQGANINQTNTDNETVLIRAIKQTGIVQKVNILQLIQLGVNTKIKDSSGKQAIDYAIQYGDKDVINQLLNSN